jgi:hypothetical protein
MKGKCENKGKNGQRYTDREELTRERNRLEMDRGLSVSSSSSSSSSSFPQFFTNSPIHQFTDSLIY